MRVLNYGGGTNSTALAILAIERRERPDILVFADTGSERPETYAYLDVFRTFLGRHSIALEVVRWMRRDGSFTPLHEDCEAKKTLPSKAFGLAGCTVKWKQQPVDKWLSHHPDVLAEHRAGRVVERWIGYDADEPERAYRMLEKNPAANLWKWRAPLVEWGMGRDECIDVIRRAGLPLPGKSACWMCPSSKPREVLDLMRNHPALGQRALQMERQAELVNVKGLGRSWAWADVVDADKRQLRLPLLDEVWPPIEAECGCYDGAN